MKIINLIDDISINPTYLQEHGLSFYVETPKHKIVIDTGSSAVFLENARRLHLDLSTVDTVILTHGHYDHCGGVKALLEIAPQAKVYIQRTAFDDFYNSDASQDGSHIAARFIGIDKTLMKLPQLTIVDGNLVIDEELELFSGIPGQALWVTSNHRLRRIIDGKPVQDNFDHEQFLVLRAEGKTILFTGCCHNGIVNVMAEYNARCGASPDIVIGGLHLMQPRHCEYSEEDLYCIDQIGRRLKDYPTKFYTCHCTGTPAYDRLKTYLDHKIVYVHSADSIDLNF